MTNKNTRTRTPIIAIVGRPNVGKSSLFNRLINKRLAITSDIAGTTRDRIYFHTEIDGISSILVDTGGLEYGKKESIEADVQSQVNIAIKDADLIFFLVDAKEGITIEDHKAADILRKSNKPLIFIANKIDNKSAVNNLSDCINLGFGNPVEISAYHDINISLLESEASSILKDLGWETGEQLISSRKKEEVSICFLGKPNVGKSSLVNSLLGREKVIVSDIPGTTRDATDTDITWNEQKYILIDTAGLRRRGKIERGLEKLSSFRSLDAIERSDIVCLILDYEEGIRKQDQHISSYAQEAGKGVILVVNKCDLMDEKEKNQIRLINILRKRFDFIPWAPVIFVSALNKTNIEKILELSKKIYDERFKRIPDEELNLFMKEITYKHLPPAHSGKLPKFYSMEQDAVNPPCFVYYINDPKCIHFSYRRYLENELRKKYGFDGTSIRLYFKEKKIRKRRRR